MNILQPIIDSPVENAVFVAITVAIGIWVYMLAKKPIHELFSKSSLSAVSPSSSTSSALRLPAE
ncbi:MAG: hypothetical protein J6D34_04950 [Atopobiaceae bacterium]|nr:hypothetical protein [Atopobiaceae bacterium]